MKLNHKVFGQGDPIIILHGLLGALDNWQTIAKKLAEKYLIYTVDQRNHGRSPHIDGMSYPLMSKDLQAFMQAQWIHRSHIIGHSMGGKTAMQFALEHPDMVDKLVVVDIGPKAYADGHTEIFEALSSMDIAALENREQADDWLQDRIRDFDVRQFLLKNLNRTPDGNYEWRMNLPVIRKDYEQILAAVEVVEPYRGPTLFIRGGQSDYIRDSDLETIRELFPQAEIQTVEGADHWVHAEAPEAFLRLVQNFLE